ncbi:MAG: nitroreductase family protein [Anaerolineae bacterium]
MATLHSTPTFPPLGRTIAWPFTRSVADLVRERYSCRAYLRDPLAPDLVQQITELGHAVSVGPFGAPLRFELTAATDEERNSLRGLGTYGLIRDPSGFLSGVVGPGKRNMEDFGFALETLVLYLTNFELGTVWLGGNFTRSAFSDRIGQRRDEILPAVIATGYPNGEYRQHDRLRPQVRADSRRPWETLFLEADFRTPLTRDTAGAYTLPLDMLRLAPSAVNGQPWRVIRDGTHFHFYVQRSTRGRAAQSFFSGLPDLQRVDVGIAMAHFALTASELHLTGAWVVQEPELRQPANAMEYLSTWTAAT